MQKVLPRRDHRPVGVLTETSVENSGQKIHQGIFAPLVFFGLYGLPLTKEKLWQLLYKVRVEPGVFGQALSQMVSAKKIYFQDGYFALKPWDEGRILVNKPEIEKRWRKVAKYCQVLASIPFIEHVSVIHSLAIGNVDQESDIDFLVISKPNRLYFVRSIIIVVFRLLGIYKTRKKISEQFCFGYYLTTDSMDISKLEGADDFLAFWFASHIGILGDQTHEQFLSSNAWVKDYFPNYQPASRPSSLIVSPTTKFVKALLEIILILPAILLEPILRQVHIRHTFSLPENHWPTSTTIARRDVLKLHAVSQRQQINQAFERVLAGTRNFIKD